MNWLFAGALAGTLALGYAWGWHHGLVTGHRETVEAFARYAITSPTLPP